MAIRVVLADDHTVVRQGLASILDEDEGIEVVGQAREGKEALELVESLDPDVLLLDFSMPDGMDGVTVASTLTERNARTRVLFLSMHENVHIMRRAIDAGGAGYVVKSADTTELVSALHKVHAGESYVSEKLAAPEESGGPAHRQGIDKLSNREFQLLRLLGRGRTLQEASQEMGVTESTASTYRARLMGKLGLENTAQIIRFAIENDVDG